MPFYLQNIGEIGAETKKDKTRTEEKDFGANRKLESLFNKTVYTCRHYLIVCLSLS